MIWKDPNKRAKNQIRRTRRKSADEVIPKAAKRLKKKKRDKPGAGSD